MLNCERYSVSNSVFIFFIFSRFTIINSAAGPAKGIRLQAADYQDASNRMGGSAVMTKGLKTHGIRIISLFLSLVILLSFGIVPVAADSPNSLVAYYPFDGDTQDYSSNGYHGTLYGATYVPGLNGQALKFSGSSSSYGYAAVNINPSAMPQMTMTAWARVESSPTSSLRAVVSHDNANFDRSLYYDNRGGGWGWSCFSGNSSVLGYRPAYVQEWVFLAAVYDQTAGTVKLYVNDQTYQESGSLGSGHNFINIGRNPSFQGEAFNGVIDNVRIYNYALTAEELADLRSADLAKTLQGTGKYPLFSPQSTSAAISIPAHGSVDLFACVPAEMDVVFPEGDWQAVIKTDSGWSSSCDVSLGDFTSNNPRIFVETTSDLEMPFISIPPCLPYRMERPGRYSYQ
jgi:hypothetical protein